MGQMIELDELAPVDMDRIFEGFAQRTKTLGVSKGTATRIDEMKKKGKVNKWLRVNLKRWGVR